MTSNIRNTTRARHAPLPSGMEFVVVRTDNCRFQLTRDEGARLMARLDRWWSPRWVEFTDLHGSLVRLRTAAILEIFDTGPATRYSESAFYAALTREGRAYDEMLDNNSNEE